MQSYNGNRLRRKIKSKKNAVPYKPKIEYTEDGFAVTTLYLRSLGKEIRRDQLHSYFSQFGNVQNVRIHAKPSFAFAFVTFALAESAAKALARREHRINGFEVNVAVADSWHQEKPLEICNNHKNAAATRQAKLPIELTNATGTYLLDMNDDCLYEIFSLKYVSIMDLCSVAESSTRLKQIANRIFALAHKRCNLNEMSLKTIHEMRRFLINFGSSITELSIGPSHELEQLFDGMSSRVLDLVIRYCTKTLESLTLQDYEITEYLTVRLRPLFNNLQKLCIEEGCIDGHGKQLFSNCRSLAELKVINLENCTSDIDMIFDNHFPKLEKFKFKKDYDDYDDYNLELFVSRHKGLKTFSMKGFNDDCTDLLPVIASNCKDLEKLQIKGQGEANQNDYEKALMSLMVLKNLTKLKMNCADVNVTKFIQELPKLSSLDILELWNAQCDAAFIPALAQIKNLKVLRLSYCNTLRNLNPLAEMESLNELSILLRGSTGVVEFDLVQMIKRLTNLKKLVLGIDTFKMEKRMYLKIVDVIRARENPSPLEIRTNSIEVGVADLQFDGKNNQIVVLDKIMYSGSENSSDEWSDDYSDSDFNPFFDDDDDNDDDDDGIDLHPALLLPFLGHRFLNGFANSDDESENNEVW